MSHLSDRSPSQLTGALLDALDTRPPHTLVPAAAGTAFQGVLTAGIWPALAMPTQLRKAIGRREQIAERLVDWASANVGDGEARDLQRASASRLPHTASVASTVFAVAALASAGWLLATSAASIGFLWYADPFRAQAAAPEATLPLGVYLASIGLSFVLHWLAANLHLRQGRAILKTARDTLGLQPAKLPPSWEWGIRPVATIVGGVLAWIGLTWALPMLVSAKAHGRIVAGHDRQTFKGLAAAVRAAAAKGRPPVALPGPADRTEIGCPNPSCDALLSEDAAFCPRCGRPTVAKSARAEARLA